MFDYVVNIVSKKGKLSVFSENKIIHYMRNQTSVKKTNFDLLCPLLKTET